MNPLSLLFPPVCPGCGKVTQIEGFCPSCLPKWQSELTETCPRCQNPIPTCTCRIFPPDETTFPRLQTGLSLIYLTHYRKGSSDLSASLLYRAKEKHLHIHEIILQDAFTPRLKGKFDPASTIVTYIPRSPEKVRSTGTDQAKMIARAVSESTGLPVFPLLRRRRSGDQKKLDARARFAALSGKYVLDPKNRSRIASKQILLVDDIVTTGAGMLACADLLLEAGAKSVTAIAVSKTVSPKAPLKEESI